MQLLEKSHEEKNTLREEAKAEKAQLEEKLEERMAAATAEMESNMKRMREDLYEELAPEELEPLVHDDELIRLQLRLVGLYEMELISEEEHCVLENLCTDFAELQSTVPGAVVTKDRAFSVANLSFNSVRTRSLARPSLCLVLTIGLLCMPVQMCSRTRLLELCRSWWALRSLRRVTRRWRDRFAGNT